MIFSGKNNIFNMIGDIIKRELATRPAYYNMLCKAALAGLVAASSCPTEIKPYANDEMIKELQVSLVPSIQCISVQFQVV